MGQTLRAEHSLFSYLLRVIPTALLYPISSGSSATTTNGDGTPECSDYLIIFLDAESGIIYNEMCALAASLLLHVIRR
jgi:hypothetical protein